MLVVYFAGRQGLGQTFVFIEITRLFVEVGPRNAGGAVTPRDTSVRVFPGDVIDVEILQRDHLTLEAQDLGHMGDLARAVAHAGRLDDDVDGRCDHLADGPAGKVEATHQDHALQPAQTFARAVGVERSHGAVMARVHRLEQIERLGSCLLYTSPSPRDRTRSRMPSSA